MILKEFQKNALSEVRTFLEQLTEWRRKAAKAHEIDPDLAIDWVAKAWEKAAPLRPYSPRRNGLGEPLPAFLSLTQDSLSFNSSVLCTPLCL